MPFQHRGRADQEPRVHGLVVRRRAVAERADDLLARDLHVLHLDRAGLVAAQAERVPERGLRLHVLAVDHEHRQVVVALEVRARGLHHVEVGEPARGRPGRLLVHLVAAVRLLGLGGERVPEVRAGLRVRVGQRADLDVAVERADVLVHELVGRPQHDRRDRGHVHDVTHGGGGAAVAGERLADHREGHVVLAEAAVFLRHRQRQEAVLRQDLEVAARIQQLVVRALRIRAHLGLAELDQLAAQLLLALGQEPVRVPLVAKPPEGLVSPHLLHDLLSPGRARSYKYVQTGSTVFGESCPCRR